MMNHKSTLASNKRRKPFNLKETVWVSITIINIDKLEEALRCYQEAIRLFKSQIDLASTEKKSVFKLFLQNYEDKTEQLQV